MKLFAELISPMQRLPRRKNSRSKKSLGDPFNNLQPHLSPMRLRPRCRRQGRSRQETFAKASSNRRSNNIRRRRRPPSSKKSLLPHPLLPSPRTPPLPPSPLHLRRSISIRRRRRRRRRPSPSLPLPPRPSLLPQSRGPLPRRHPTRATAIPRPPQRRCPCPCSSRGSTGSSSSNNNNRSSSNSSRRWPWR